MQAVIWDEDRMLEAPLAEAARRFLEALELTPLASEAYRDGPAVLLTTETRFVYVVGEDAVWWVVEWPPGVVVVRFAENGSFAVARASIDDDEHPAVELVATAWAAQFDPDERDDAGFGDAVPSTVTGWTTGMAAVQALGEALSASFADEAAIEAWRARAVNSPWVRET